jgi:FkbM family methyltransferase
MPASPPPDPRDPASLPPPPAVGPPEFGSPEFGVPEFGIPEFGGPEWGGGEWGGAEFGAPIYPEPDFAGQPAPPPPTVAPPGPEKHDRLLKAELEAAMLAAPDDQAVRGAYFSLLTRLAVSQSGLMWAHLPELPAPLAFRCATPDIGVLTQLFRQPAAAPQFRPTPMHILVIGAYAGFSAVQLARQHPRAALLCAEPLADNFRLLSMNTTAWPRIRVAQAAVWHSSTRLAPMGRFQADWSVSMTSEALDADRTVAALSVPDLLARAGWSRAEMVVCDASGAEREIFADPYSHWLTQVDVVQVRPHEQVAKGAEATLARCFPTQLFERRVLGDQLLFVRREPRMALPAAPPGHSLLSNTPDVAPIALEDVPQAPWGFFVFDGLNMQLHPNAPGGKPSRALFQVPAEGHAGFVSDITHAGLPGVPPVRFTVIVQRQGGQVVGRGDAVVPPRQRGRLTLKLPPAQPGDRAPLTIVLQTEMAPGAPHNQMAWARWLDPRLV